MGLFDTIQKVGSDVKKISAPVRQKASTATRDIAPVLESGGKGGGALLSGWGEGVGNVLGGGGKAVSNVAGSLESLTGSLGETVGDLMPGQGTLLIIGGIAAVVVIGGIALR